MDLKYALLIIDAQVNMFEGASLYQSEHIIKVIKSLIKKARSLNVPVIWIRNNGDLGEPDEHGTNGWEINPILEPKKGDIVIDKHNPDSFKDTDLKSILNRKNITDLIIAGMQTEICISSTVKRAVELGYNVTVVEDGHSTFDSDDVKASHIIEEKNKELGAISKILKEKFIAFN